MLFQNISFMVFCLLTFALYWRLPRLRLWILALANAVFYMAAGWQNLGLFLGASAATFLLGQFVTGSRGRLVMWGGILLNLANLCFFKYAGFLTSNLHPFFPWIDPGLVKDVLLPIGISFYTFQHISYLVDRRIKELPPAPNYLHFWVYISFFGHSIAGPIMRGHEFFPQIAETTAKRFDSAQFRYGLYLFLLGLAKKVAIADQLAPEVNRCFATPYALTTGDAWVAALFFAFQIYYDFSAYSDMAVGIGHMFGYQLTLNFKTPYVAANGAAFWDRWHITLSRWIRDYVYIPLGGSLCEPARQYLNLFLAMLASGFWHGAAWTFILWGAFHGFLLLGQRLWEKAKVSLGWVFFRSRAYRIIATLAFFLLVTMGWVLFRASDLDSAIAILRAMMNFSTFDTLLMKKKLLFVAALLYGLHLIEYWMREREVQIGEWWQQRIPSLLQGAFYAGVVLLIMVSYRGAQNFIYFRF